MTDCGEFWFWFMRPFAETMGTLALFLVVAMTFLIILMVKDRVDKK